MSVSIEKYPVSTENECINVPANLRIFSCRRVYLQKRNFSRKVHSCRREIFNAVTLLKKLVTEFPTDHLRLFFEITPVNSFHLCQYLPHLFKITLQFNLMEHCFWVKKVEPVNGSYIQECLRFDSTEVPHRIYWQVHLQLTLWDHQ